MELFGNQSGRHNGRLLCRPAKFSRFSFVGGLCWLSVCLLLSGCSGSPKLEPFSGEVTLDGNPIGPLSLVFKSTDLDRMGCNVIAVDGNFQLEPAQGLAPGAYHVTIEVLQPDLEDYEQRRSQRRSGLADIRIPEKYGKPQAFTIEVVAEKENHFRFELSSR